MDKVTLSLNAPKLQDILGGLTGLDGATGDREKSTYKFSPSFRMRNARNLQTVKTALQLIDAERRKIQLAMPFKDDKGFERAEREKQAEMVELNETPHELALETFTEAELQLEKNPLPVSVIGCLIPLLAEAA